MEHPAELAVHSYLEQVTTNKKTMSEENIRKIADDVAKSLRRQFCERRGGTGDLPSVPPTWVDLLVSYGIRRTSLRRKHHYTPRS